MDNEDIYYPNSINQNLVFGKTSQQLQEISLENLLSATATQMRVWGLFRGKNDFYD